MDHETQVLLEYRDFVKRLYRRVGRGLDKPTLISKMISEVELLSRSLPESEKDARLGNLVFLLQAYLNEADISLTTVMQANKKRLLARYPTGYLPGSALLNLDFEKPAKL